MKLNAEERTLLAKLNKEQLVFLSSIADDKNFPILVDIVNYFIDLEKNIFFSAKEYDDRKLAIDHAFSRGGIAKLVEFLHIIGGAKAELNKRTEK